MLLDCFGKPCPMPLVEAKKEIDAGCRELQVKVDNDIAVKNLSRLSERYGLAMEVAEIEGGFLISFTEGEGAPAAAPAEAAAPSPAGLCGPAGCGYSVFVGKDHVGEGEGELGKNLLKMALYTLGQADVLPASVLFMNSGVKVLCEEGGQIVEHVQALQAAGTEVLVCGTCLDFYGIKEQLQVGDISNMYDILGRMHDAAKVITL